MPRTLALTLTMLAACAAADTALPPDADKAYRAYVAALAKTYVAETPRLLKTLKAQETTMRKKDPAAADAVAALATKVEKAGVFEDLAPLVVAGDLLPDGTNPTDALIGTWDFIPTGYVIAGNQTYTFTRDHTLVLTTTSPASSYSNTFPWEMKDGAVVVNLAPGGAQMGAGRSQIRTMTIKMPVPANGRVLVSQHDILRDGANNVDSTTSGTLTRHVEQHTKR